MLSLHGRWTRWTRWASWTSCLAAAFMMAWMTNAASAQSLQEPVWPQQFQVFAGESTTFGFVVTQPGTITVNVTSQGAPIVLSLAGPLTQAVQQQGSGNLSLSYMATSADLQKSYLWQVRMTPTTTAAPATNGPPQLLASGTISVQHPAANMSLAAPAITQKIQAQHAAMAAQATKLKAVPPSLALLVPLKATTASPTTASSQSAPATTSVISPAAFQSLQQKVLSQLAQLPRTAVTGAVVPAGTHAAPVPQGGATSLTTVATGIPHVSPGTPAGKGSTLVIPTNVGTVSSIGPTIDPTRSYTNVVMKPASNGTFPDWFIWGANFGSQAGQLHFLAGGSNIVVPTYQWSNQSIAFQLPELLFDQTTPVQAYIVTSQGQTSNSITYQYAPILPQVSGYVACADPAAGLPWCALWMSGAFWGTSGQLHFVNSSGVDSIISTSYWSDDVLVTSGTGVYQFTGFSGQVYVKRGTSVSNRANLQLGPWNYALVTLPLVSSGLANPWDPVLWPFDVSHSSDLFSGHKGNDQFFQAHTLKNGWVVDSVNFSIDPSCVSAGLWGSEGAYLTQTPVAATTDPSTAVNWWVDASNNEICYKLSVNIRGPQGVAYW